MTGGFNQKGEDMAKLRLEPPWETYYKELNLLLGEDPDILVLYDSYEQEIRIYSEDEHKANALNALLPTEKEFGNVKVTIAVIPANGKHISASAYTPELFEDLFEANPCVVDIETTAGIYEATYVVFRKKVVQYHNDNIGDINGNCSTLYQDIAERIFDNHPGVHFCTASLESIQEHPSCYCV